MKKILSLMLLSIAMVSLSACGSTNTEETTVSEGSSQEGGSDGSGESTGDALAKIKEKGKLVVATSAEYAPYEFKILEDGKEKIVGFDIDIANEIAKDLDVELEILDLDFNGLLVALNSDKADIVIAGMTPDEERKKAVDFSEIYYTAEQGIVISAENKGQLDTLESFDGKKIGVQKGSIQEKLTIEQIPNAEIISLTKIPNIILELQSGKIDAAVIELPVADGYINQFPELTLSATTIQDETGGSAIAIKKGNQDLVDAVNKTIARLDADGSIDGFVVNANKIVSELSK